MSKAISAIFGPFLQNCRGTFWCLSDWLWTSLIPCTLASFSFHKHSSRVAEAAVSQSWKLVQLWKALPRMKLEKTPFCLTLGLFVCAALNAVVWDNLLVIQRAQVFLLSSISVAILLSVSPGLLQSHSQTAVFVPTINRSCTCHTEMFGGSNWLIDLFAVEQAYFIYAELLHLKEGKRREQKERELQKILQGSLQTHTLSTMSREGRVPQVPGEASFPKSRGENGQGQAHCETHWEFQQEI